MNLTDTSNVTDSTDYVAYIFNEIGVPLVCCFGIVGNLLNLAVLTQKQLQSSMDRMEKSAHLGLVALATSDLLFCIFALPMFSKATKEIIFYSPKTLFPLYYNMFKTAILNIFVTCSTWLTVVMASARYLAICHPLHARGFINLCGTKITITLVFIFSILLNLPSFWLKTMVKRNFSENCTIYRITFGDVFKNETFEYSYQALWAVVAVFLPIMVLAFCNICLIRALQQSMHMQRKYRVNRPKQDSGHRITPTLITIVVLFMVLVVPSEIIKFTNFILEKQDKHSQGLRYAKVITNFLQASNFAINFILYCILNKHFRNTILYFLCCGWKKTSQPKATSQNHTMTLMTDIETDM